MLTDECENLHDISKLSLVAKVAEALRNTLALLCQELGLPGSLT